MPKRHEAEQIAEDTQDGTSELGICGSSTLLVAPLERVSHMAKTVSGMNVHSPDAIDQALKLLRGKWTVQVLWAMRERSVRLSELKRLVPSASKKGLVASLRSLEELQVVIRRDLSESVLHVEYEIVNDLRVLVNILLRCLSDWTGCLRGLSNK